MSKTVRPKAVDEASRKLGGLKELAARLGISDKAIMQWEIVPVRRVLVMEELSGVSRHEIRPDIYGPAPAQRNPVSKARAQRVRAAACQ